VLAAAGIYYFVTRTTSALVTGEVFIDKQLILVGKVEITTADNKKLTSAIGSNGAYQFKDVPFGDATITVSLPAKLNPKDYDVRIKSLQGIYREKRQAPPPVRSSKLPIPASATSTTFKLSVQDAVQIYNLEISTKS